MIEKALNAIDMDTIVKANGPYFPSPIAWEDQVLYFMMLDRFSDGNEIGYNDAQGRTHRQGSTPKFKSSDQGNAIKTESDAMLWRVNGEKWQGGNLKGLRSKIGYLKRLGVTAIWVSPIFKQISFEETYHGYGIQNFLDIDPHFGSREDLKNMVQEAHQHGIYVIMDIILNHSGNVFDYDPDRYWTNISEHDGHFDPRWDNQLYPVKGFQDEDGRPKIPFQHPVDDAFWPNGAIWPREFQKPKTFTRKGRIHNWDHDPEYREGDFCNLKDLALGQGSLHHYQESETLRNLIQCYQFWIAYADIDGFRVDTVKHMDDGATRFFTSCIHEFTQTLGKENFYLIGEITGGRAFAFQTMEETGLNAALGINEIPGKLEWIVKGKTDPVEYFQLFRHSLSVGKDSHTWFKNKVITMFDDHDQVRKGHQKARFCADDAGRKLILPILALNLLTEGIPCIYYGTEQAFDGQGDHDKYLRECMFGGGFGAFRSKGKHFFDEENQAYKGCAKIIQCREKHLILRRGRQYLREISGNGIDFAYPRVLGDGMRSIVAWSRILNNQEMLVLINTDTSNTQSAWVTVDDHIQSKVNLLTCIFSFNEDQVGNHYAIEERNGRSIYVTLDPSGVMVIG